MMWIRVVAVSTVLGALSFAVPGAAVAQSDDGPLGCGIVWGSDVTFVVPSAGHDVAV